MRKSFRNLVYKGISYRVSPKGMVISSFLKMSRKRAKYHSLSFFDGTKGYGISFTRTEGISFLASQTNWLLVLVVKTSSPLSLLSLFSFSPSSLYLSSPSSLLTSFNTPSALFSALSLLLLLVKIVLHSSLGLFPVLVTKLLVDFLANCLANWPTCTSRFLITDSVLLWFDRETYINWVRVSSNLVVLS